MFGDFLFFKSIELPLPQPPPKKSTRPEKGHSYTAKIRRSKTNNRA